MTVLRGISDTINLLDRYNFDYVYDWDANTYEISDKDFQLALMNSKNKQLTRSLEVGKGSTMYNGSRNTLLAAEEISDKSEGEILYTPAAILDLLSQIDELSDYDLSLTEGFDGTLQLQVGNSYYALESNAELDIQVDEKTLDEIEDINEEAYQHIADLDDNLEDIEGGLIKEALKTLLIGGIVRAGKKYLQS